MCGINFNLVVSLVIPSHRICVISRIRGLQIANQSTSFMAIEPYLVGCTPTHPNSHKGLFGCTRIHLNSRVLEWIRMKIS